MYSNLFYLLILCVYLEKKENAILWAILMISTYVTQLKKYWRQNFSEIL